MQPKQFLPLVVAALNLGMNHVASAQAACVPAHKFPLLTNGVIQVATGAVPPFDVISSTGDYTGVDADILKRVAAMECVKLTTVVVDPPGQIQYVLSGKADISAFGWYRSAARDRVLSLSQPLLLERLAIYSKDGTTSISALKSRRVGTVQGYLWVTDLQGVLGDSLKLYPNPVALAQDLGAGRVDAAIDSYTKGIYAQRTQGGYKGFQIKPADPDKRVATSMLPAQTTFLMSRSNQAFAKAVDADVQNLRSSGEIARILRSYQLDPSAADVGDPRLVQ